MHWFTIDIIIIVVLGLGVLRIIYTVGGNDRATMKIARAREEIDRILAKHGRQLHEITFGRDCAPCEVEYSIVHHSDRGLPGRIMLQMLQDLKAGAIDIEDIVTACNKAQAKHERRKNAASTL